MAVLVSVPVVGWLLLLRPETRGVACSAAPGSPTGCATLSTLPALNAAVLPEATSSSPYAPGHPPAGMQGTNTFWASAPTASNGVGSYLMLRFFSSESIDGFGIDPGAAVESRTYREYATPTKIELVFSSGPPIYETVAPTSSFQRWTFAERATTSLEILILAVSPGSGSTVERSECAVTDVVAFATP